MTSSTPILISIIIPMYNVEAFVERCIRSIETQDISAESYEVIVVNDGSPDNSRAIVIRLMAEYKNIILIEQENMGVSVARNRGIEVATGKYLLFIDPDDYIKENCFSSIYRFAAEVDLQVAIFPFLDDMLKISYISSSTDVRLEGVRTGIELYKFARRMRGETGADSSCGMLFQRNYLIENNLMYTNHVPFLEDGEFISRVLCLSGRCGFIDIPFYIRTERPGSATNSEVAGSINAINGFLIALNNLYEFRNKLSLTTTQYEFLNQPICKFTFLPITFSIRKGLKQILFVRSELRKNNLRKLELRGLLSPYDKFARVYNLSVFLFIIVYSTHMLHRSFRSKYKSLLSKKDGKG
jgi:glycosyltransferase involved in cell wall biosynthesis